MKPIYFPFTTIPPSVLEKIGLFFPGIILYRPSTGAMSGHLKKKADEGVVEIRAPFTGDEDRLEKLVREYQQWIELHQGSETTFLKNRIFDSADIESVPLFDETSTSQIKSDIKKGGVSKKPPRPDPVFAARLFLLIAQNFDIQHEEFIQDMENFHLMENELFSSIRGDNEFSDIETGRGRAAAVPDDPGLHKTAQRIAAWFKLFRQDPAAPDEFGSCLFITSSPAVMDHILENCPDNHLVLSASESLSEKPNEEKIFQLQDKLYQISKNPDVTDSVDFPDIDPAKETAFFRLFCFTENSIRSLFKKPFNENLSVSGLRKIFIGIIDTSLAPEMFKQA